MQKVAMISGASRGIGHAVARQLHEAGFLLSLGVRDPEGVGARDAAALPGARYFPYDATDRKAELRWVEATVEAFGRIDVLVNAAGICPIVTLETGTDDDLDLVLEINVKAPYRMVRAALPYLRATGEGRVINLSSLSGKRVLGLNVGYQMSKHAIMALSHAVRRIGWDDGIRATAVCPGFVATDMAESLTDMRPEEMTTPQDLARLIATVVQLPNTASIPELVVNNRYEHTL